MKKIIVTGATSMIGVALIKEALKHECEIYAIVRPNSNRKGRLPQADPIHIIEAELEHLNDLSGISECDVFYHFAWSGTGKADRDNPRGQGANILYSLEAVDLAYKYGCKKFIGAGSQAEYGIVDTVIDEDTPCHPTISYGMAKLSASMLCGHRCEQLGMEFVWGRIFSVYGINDNTDTMLDYAIKNFIEGKPANFSSGTQMWNYLYEEDAGRFFYLLGDRCVDRGIYNIAYPCSKPLREYIETLMEVASYKYGLKAKCNFGCDNLIMNRVELHTYPHKLMKAIGNQTVVSFEDGISRVIKSKV